MEKINSKSFILIFINDVMNLYGPIKMIMPAMGIVIGLFLYL